MRSIKILLILNVFLFACSEKEDIVETTDLSNTKWACPINYTKPSYIRSYQLWFVNDTLVEGYNLEYGGYLEHIFSGTYETDSNSFRIMTQDVSSRMRGNVYGNLLKLRSDGEIFNFYNRD